MPDINVKKIAGLARLGLDKNEEKRFEKDLSSILDFVAKLDEAETENIEPTAHVTGALNVLRPDETDLLCQDRQIREQILKNAPSRENGYYKVKRVLE